MKEFFNNPFIVLSLAYLSGMLLANIKDYILTNIFIIDTYYEEY